MREKYPTSTIVNAFRCTVGSVFSSRASVEEIFKRQIGVQASNHVEFRRAFAQTLFGAL